MVRSGKPIAETITLFTRTAAVKGLAGHGGGLGLDRGPVAIGTGGLGLAQTRRGLESDLRILVHLEAGPRRHQVAQDDIFLQADQVMTPDPETLPGDMPIRDVVVFFADHATHRSYPVVGKDDRLLGLVSRSDALRWQGERGQSDTPLADELSDASQPLAYRHAPIGEVADVMVETGIGRIPIVDADTGKVVGILSRHDLLKARGERRRAEVERARGGVSS